MKFLKGTVEPMYLICSSTKFYKWCDEHHSCFETAFKATLGAYVDERYPNEHCAPTQVCNCGC